MGGGSTNWTTEPHVGHRSLDRSVPWVVERVLPVVHAVAREAITTFFRGGAADNFRVYLDETCMQPENWRDNWAAPPPGEPADEYPWWPTKYAAQGFIPHMLEHSPWITTDWKLANASIAVLYVYHLNGAMAVQQRQCLERLRQCSPAFRHDNGSRHFFIFPNDRGPCCIDGRRDYTFFPTRDTAQPVPSRLRLYCTRAGIKT